jgi:hypothetical protein
MDYRRDLIESSFLASWTEEGRLVDTSVTRVLAGYRLSVKYPSEANQVGITASAACGAVCDVGPRLGRARAEIGVSDKQHHIDLLDF